jgi:lysophospholipase L1-like esterase
MTGASLSRIPAHLACAVTMMAFVAVGSGASCGRDGESGRPSATANDAAAKAAPPTTAAEGAAPPSTSLAAPTTSAKGAASPSPSAAAPSPGGPSPSAESAPAPVAKRYVIAALGDSITDKRSRGGGYLDVVAAHCPETVIDNYGKGGDMVNQMRRRFESDILPVAKERGYSHLIVFGGVNDLYSDLTAGRTNDRIESDLSAIYAEARQNGMAVIAITVAPWGGFTRYFDARRAENTRLLNGWISSQVASKTVERVIDSYALLSCGDAERLCPEYTPPFRDGLHPGSKGHEVLGKALYEQAFADCR